jgi:hypothetical protein
MDLSFNHLCQFVFEINKSSFKLRKNSFKHLKERKKEKI